MDTIGKIFVFAVFIMSLVLMTFAGAVYMSHQDWKQEVERLPAECLPGQKPGYRYQLEEAQKEREKFNAQIDELVKKVAESEQGRDQVLAKLQSALVRKDEELSKARSEKDERQKKMEEAVADLAKTREDLKLAAEKVENLQAQVAEQQRKVDEQVKRSAVLSADLAEVQSQLAIATERKAQLEKQVANSRILLQERGLSLDSAPRAQVPVLDGRVTAVAAGSIQVSIGSDVGLQVGHTLEVYRDGQYVGRATVTSVKPDSAIAELIKAYTRGVVQSGDKVTTKPKA